MNARFTASDRNALPPPTVLLAQFLRTKSVTNKPDPTPPKPVLSAAPEKELEQRLKDHPGDADVKVDVGSDESMDASDPSAAAQPGCDNEPAPSSGFPE